MHRRRSTSRRSLGTIALGLALAVLVAVPIGALAYDAATPERLPEGIRVAGVDVGDRTPEEARSIIRDRVAGPIERTIVARHAGRQFELGAERARLEVDVEATVDAASKESPDGVPGLRAMRDLLGDRQVDVEVQPRVRYAKWAVAAFAGAVADRVDRDARDATVQASGQGLEVTSSRRGFDADARELARRVAAALQSPTEHTVTVPGETRQPEVTTAGLAERHPHYITIDRAGFELHYYEHLELEETYAISVGQVGHSTPEGLYDISDKAVNPTWYVPDSDWAGERAGEVIPPGPENPLKSRWLGVQDGIGVHGTDEVSSIGRRASRGCIRMLIPEVEELYDKVPVGTPVYIG